MADNERVYCMTGYKGFSALAIPLSAQGDISDSNLITWKKREGTPYVPSPLLWRGRLYYTKSNQPILSCVNSETGKAVFPITRLPKLFGVYASPVAAAGRIYISGRGGNTVVLKDSDKFEVLSSNRLDDQFNASPALVGNRLLLRGRKFLYCIGKQ